MTGAATAVVGLSVALMIFAGPLYDYSKRTADDLLHPERYIAAVIEDQGDLVGPPSGAGDLAHARVGTAVGRPRPGEPAVRARRRRVRGVHRPADRRAGIQLTSFHPASAVVFLVYFLVQLVKSNFQVAWEVITPGSNVNRAIIAVPLHVTTDGLVTLVGNAITLTPGTLTVDVRADDPDRPPVLYVHALHFTDVESLRSDVLRLERLAVRAFGTKEQRVELDRVVAAWPQGGSQ